MKVEVPDIGDFTDVPVIEILVKPGDEVTEEQPLITLESDKATMEVPSPAAGTVEKVLVEVGDKRLPGHADHRARQAPQSTGLRGQSPQSPRVRNSPAATGWTWW